MNLLLSDKAALVIAGSKGIGKGIATTLAAEGCRVIITSHSHENLKKAALEIKEKTKKDVATFVMDLNSSESIESSCRQISSSVPRIDILITNGPGPKLDDATKVNLKALEGALAINLVSAIKLCNYFLPGMIERKFGRIIHLTSTIAKEPDQGMVLSSISRAGLLAYSKSLAKEVARYGVTVNSILTGGVMTERTIFLIQESAKKQNIAYDDLLKRAHEEVPVGYISTPEQFSYAIAFLASPLSMYLTGISLPIDGGTMKMI